MRFKFLVWFKYSSGGLKVDAGPKIDFTSAFFVKFSFHRVKLYDTPENVMKAKLEGTTVSAWKVCWGGDFERRWEQNNSVFLMFFFVFLFCFIFARNPIRLSIYAKGVGMMSFEFSKRFDAVW